jgi:leucine efflux protein
VSFYGVTDLWTYVIGAIAIILLPGPNSLFVLSVASTRGARAGYRAAGGVFLGDSILLLLTALGAASLLRSYPALFMVVKYSGAAYLSYLGIKLLITAVAKKQAAEPSSKAVNADANQQRPFHRALVVSLLNPKAILFLLSFFVQFIDPAYAYPALPFLILSAIIMSFSVAYLVALIAIGTRAAEIFKRKKRLTAALSAAVGCLFVGFGIKLATASLN